MDWFLRALKSSGIRGSPWNLDYIQMFFFSDRVILLERVLSTGQLGYHQQFTTAPTPGTTISSDP